VTFTRPWVANSGARDSCYSPEQALARKAREQLAPRTAHKVTAPYQAGPAWASPLPTRNKTTPHPEMLRCVFSQQCNPKGKPPSSARTFCPRPPKHPVWGSQTAS
jgi:hypothetical protein